MTAALRLVERGCQVSIFEATNRVGGKAGSNRDGADYNDHGYHVFPLWYLNTWKLVEELGIQENFVDVTDMKQLEAGEFPIFKTVRNPNSVRYFWQNLTSGVLPIPETFLMIYSILDLMSQPYRLRALIDQISMVGFLRSRFYRNEAVAQKSQEWIFKSISVQSYLVSAMTVRNVMRYWVKYPAPAYRIPNGSLQQSFIEPIRRKLEESGCRIHMSHTLKGMEFDEKRVTKLIFHDGGQVREQRVDNVILAIPAEKVAELIDDRFYTAAPRLAEVKYIYTEPMAALNLYLNRRITDLPRCHVNLTNSKFGLSFIDVSQTWKGYSTSVLNVIASDFTGLSSLSQEAAVNEIIKELTRFVPTVNPGAIAKFNFQPHIEQPLFMNEVGVWDFRPSTSTEIANLYLAGDYCRSHVDLVSMEGAITTGLLAAEAVRKTYGIRHPVENLVPKVYPRFLTVLAKLALMPLAALAKLVTLLRPS